MMMLAFRHISLVRDEILGRRRGIDRQHGDLGIMCFPERQEEDVGAAVLVADRMGRGVSSAFGDFDTMSKGPPFAPPAVRYGCGP